MYLYGYCGGVGRHVGEIRGGSVGVEVWRAPIMYLYGYCGGVGGGVSVRGQSIHSMEECMCVGGGMWKEIDGVQ